MFHTWLQSFLRKVPRRRQERNIRITLQLARRAEEKRIFDPTANILNPQQVKNMVRHADEKRTFNLIPRVALYNTLLG